MTERLYYQDPELLEFEARIVDTGITQAGHYTVLDRSAFYPTSGGQLHDTGSLNDIAVIDVIEGTDKVIRHITSQPVGNPGDSVTGSVDTERRWKNRQMHTAQHILSQVFIKLLQAETVSVHLGEEYGAVELGCTAVTEEQLGQAERATNEIIRSNLPVEIIFAQGDEVDRLPLRKLPQRAGEIRVIKIGKLDCSACGGTHCRSTGEVGLVKLLSVEKLRGRVLVKFLAGGQALADYRRRFEVTETMTRAFTCHLDDLAPKMERLLAEQKEQRQEISRLHKELLPVRVEELAGQVKMVGNTPVVAHTAGGIDSSVANALASHVADRIGGVVLVRADDRLVVAVSDSSGMHAGKLVSRFAEHTGLRGGGSERTAQVGGADRGQLEHYVKIFESLIADA